MTNLYLLHTVPVLGEPSPPTRASDSANHASAHGTNWFEIFLKSEKNWMQKKKFISFDSKSSETGFKTKKMIWSFFVAGSGYGNPLALSRKMPQKELISALLELLF